MTEQKILIIRLSSFGDIIQTLPSVDVLQQNGFRIDFLTKKNFVPALKSHPGLNKIYVFETQNSSLFQELQNIKELIHTEAYDYIYDAHNNLRSSLILFYTFFLRWKMRLFKNQGVCIQRPKSRWKRFLLFQFRWDLFPLPFISAASFLEPLKKHIPSLRALNMKETLKSLPVQNTYNQKIDQASHWEPPTYNYICLAPSAAWALKRWPIEYYQQLIDLCPERKFIAIGGPEDDFIHQLQGPNLTNLAGQISWADTGKVLLHADLVLSADTGVLHWADYMGVNCIGLLGPTAFGVTFRDSSKILSLHLPCSPCTKDGRGKCKISETQKCLKGLSPTFVKQEMMNSL